MNEPKIVPVIIAVIRKGNRFLLTKRTEWDPEDKSLAGYPWQFPGGGLEFGEEIQDCLHREIREELGINIRNVHLLPKIFHDVRGQWHGVLICFLAEMENQRAQIILNEEASEYGFFSLEEIKVLKALPKTKEIAETAVQTLGL